MTHHRYGFREFVELAAGAVAVGLLIAAMVLA